MKAQILKRKNIVLAFTNQKGGSGKTTTAAHAYQWFNQFCNVGFVDADAQESGSKWLQSMDVEDVYRIFDAHKLMGSLPDLKTRHDILIVDAPGSIHDMTQSVLMRADIAVVPCQPTFLDMDSALRTVEMINYASDVRDGKLKAGLFLNRVETNTTLFNESVESIKMLSSQHLTPFRTFIKKRQAIADSAGQDSTIINCLDNRRAITQAREDYNALFLEILGVING